MDESAQQDALEFSDGKQAAVIGHLATDERFWNRMSPHISSWWFADPWCSKWFDALKIFHDRYKRLPTPREAVELPVVRDEGEAAYKAKLLDVLGEAYARTADFRQDALADEMMGWARANMLRRVVETVARLYDGKKVREAEVEVESYRQKVAELRLERDPELNWTEFEQIFASQEVELADALTWGSKIFDSRLHPLAKRGCLVRGDTSLVIAPTGRGKTTTMYNVVAPNVLSRHPCLVFTHEGGKSDHHLKMWCILLQMRPHEVLSLYRSPEGVALLKEWAHVLYEEKFLTFIPMERTGQMVEDVVEIAKRKQDERVAKLGEGYHLMVSDYPACLHSRAAQSSRYEHRHERRYVFDLLVDLALEMRWHLLAAAQGTRESSKGMMRQRGGREESARLSTKEDIGEAWAPCERTSAAIVIQRSVDAERQGWAAYLIDKSRTSPTGDVVICKSDFSRYLTHTDALGAAWYKSSGTLAERLGDLLEQHSGGAIPSEELA